jgi:hypothetical protein
MYKYGGKQMIRSKLNPDELEKEDPGAVSTIERRNFLEIGLVTALVFAGDAFFSVVSYMDKIFSSTDGPKEGL